MLLMVLLLSRMASIMVFLIIHTREVLVWKTSLAYQLNSYSHEKSLVWIIIFSTMSSLFSSILPPIHPSGLNGHNGHRHWAGSDTQGGHCGRNRGNPHLSFFGMASLLFWGSIFVIIIDYVLVQAENSPNRLEAFSSKKYFLHFMCRSCLSWLEFHVWTW